jgi:2',3'-cyclic-nucleotide 2'-phosphodiesterase (5'-nucleotidase family)
MTFSRHQLALFLPLVAACAGLPKPPAPPDPVRFLSINDVYTIDTLPDGNGGLARMATLKKRIAAEGPVIFVLAGDFLGPSLLSRYYSGRQMVEVLNAAGLDYATFGNHEFDVPRDTLLARIAESKFRWLSANCMQGDGRPFPRVARWDTLRAQGRKVGLFGVTLQRDYPAWVQCSSPDSAAAMAIDSLGAQGADLIVGITHQSVDADVALLHAEGALNLILGGHEHEAHTIAVGDRYVLKADADAVSAQFITVWGRKDQWREAPRLLDVRPSLPPDAAVEAIVARWRDSLTTRLGPNRNLGTVAEPLDATSASLQSRETNFGNIVADAIRAGTGADVGLVNGGAIRLDAMIPRGPLTSYMIESAFLFADQTRIVPVTLSGSRLRDLLETGVSRQNFGAGGFPQVSGIRFAIDLARPDGSRIVGPITREDASLVTPATLLRVSLPAWLACRNGDGYTVPEAAAACRQVPVGPRAADLVMQHVSTRLGGRVAGPPGWRIAQR